MIKSEIEKLLQSLVDVKVGVIGDFALDVYYELNQNTGEFSIETGKPVTYGSNIKTYLGAAGNIVNNVISLGVKDVSVFGFVGNDILGRELISLFNEKKVDAENLIVLENNWETYAYIKPFERKEEGNRLDFGSLNKPPDAEIDKLLNNLKTKIKDLDVLIINQQFVNPMVDAKTLETLNEIILENPNCKIFGDLRQNSTDLQTGILKMNVYEISRILDIEIFDEKDTSLCIDKAKQVHKIIGNPLFMTRGENGLIYIDSEESITVPGIYLTGDTDELGRGNTCVSAFAVSLGSGASIKDSLEIANVAYAIIVKRIRQTGTATPEEILKLADDCYYNYDLALAHDPRKAKYFENTEIEIIGDLPNNIQIRNVILDHDGTISTLREGWELVMHEVMMELICGDKLKDLATDEYNRISLKCEKFINDTTGIQTIIQMQGLRDIVIDEGYVPISEVKSAGEYKAIYLNKLMVSVNDRIGKFNRGERTIHDFTILGAVNFLNELKKKELTLFLASGTDEVNVVEEANALGYGDMFNGGIRGSKGNEIGDAKKIVINRII